MTYEADDCASETVETKLSRAMTGAHRSRKLAHSVLTKYSSVFRHLPPIPLALAASA